MNGRFTEEQIVRAIYQHEQGRRLRMSVAKRWSARQASRLEEAACGSEARSAVPPIKAAQPPS